jgi:hypothetical protein
MIVLQLHYHGILAKTFNRTASASAKARMTAHVSSERPVLVDVSCDIYFLLVRAQRPTTDSK